MYPAPVAELDPIAALRQDLTSAGYFTENIAEILGPTATAALARDQRIPAQQALTEPLAAQNRLAGFISCFMLADPISADFAEKLFATLGLNRALDLNIVRSTDDGSVVATIDLSAYSTDQPGDMWVASDQTAMQLGRPLPAEHILGVGKASMTLAEITPRHDVDTALDIGTGCGIQALHLLCHARHVTITDISQRALDFATFNILLNAPSVDVDPANLSDRVTVLAGNMLEPLAGQTFDLVVTNPPFVIAPSHRTTTHTYRETGHTGDHLVKELIATIDTVLADGGQAIMLANWEMFGEGSWSQRLASWPKESLDIWAIQRSSSDPAQYAEIWLRDSSEQLDPQRYAQSYASYLEDFTARGVTQIGFGWVWLRKRAATPRLQRFEYLTDVVHQPVAAAWAEAIRRTDVVQQPDSGWVLADRHLVVPDWVTYEQYQRFGAEHPEVLMARSGAGFGRHVRLDTATAAVLGACDGELTAGQLTAAVAGLLELDDTQSSALQDEISTLYIDGFLEVFEPGSTTG